MSAFSRKPKETTVLPPRLAAVEVSEAPLEARVLRPPAPALAAQSDSSKPTCRSCAAGKANEPPLLHGLRAGLETTALGLGLLRWQLDAGQTAEAREVLARLQEEFQLLRRAVESQAENLPARAAPPQRPRALLVEDDCNQRELLAGFLRLAGLKVDAVGDGYDALDYLGSHGGPDVILLDMGLPRLDGPTTLHQIRRNPAYGGIKIFGVSGHLPEEFDLERGPHGVDGWFHKPLDPAVLVHDLVEELDGSPLVENLL